MANWFDKKFDDEKLHDKFKYLLNIGYSAERKLLESWIDRFVIKDGELKTINEFQKEFHSTFWELYLNEVIVKSGAKIHNKKSSPDFYITKDGVNVCIEAVTAGIGEDGMPESTRNMNDIYGENDHYSILDESIIRASNSITVKSEKYHTHYRNAEKNKAHWELVETNPCVIALGDYAQVNYGQSFYYSLLALLYKAYFDPDDETDLKILCEDSLGNEYKYKDQHVKTDGVSLELGLFSNCKYKHISAIVYSCTLTLGKLNSLSENHEPFDKYIILNRDLGWTGELEIIRYSGSKSDESLCDGLFIFHNPFAEKPLPNNYLNGKGLTNIRFNNEENLIEVICQDSQPLKRRRVGMKGNEWSDIDNMNDFVFVQVPRE